MRAPFFNYEEPWAICSRVPQNSDKELLTGAILRFNGILTCGNKVQNKDVFCMHCGKRCLSEQKQTKELPTLTKFFKIKSVERINRFIKKKF